MTSPFPDLPNVERIYHMASPASPVAYQRYPCETMHANAEGTNNLLELARRHNARILFASTSEVYGDPLEHPQRETYWGNAVCTGPRSMYDESKRYGEALTVAHRNAFGTETRIARIFNTYGPRMAPDDGRVVSNFIVQALKGESLTVYGDGSQTRSFQYVDDLVEGLIRLMESDYADPVNIGNPVEFTMRDLAERVLELSGSVRRSSTDRCRRTTRVSAAPKSILPGRCSGGRRSCRSRKAFAARFPISGRSWVSNRTAIWPART